MKTLWKISGKRFEFPREAQPFELEQRPGGWWIARFKDSKGVSRRVRFRAFEKRSALAAQISGWLWNGSVEELSAASSAAQGPTEADFTAQFPGKVRKISVKEGQKVEAGDLLILMEAMKMEFPIKAPSAGVVKRFLVQEGASVSPGTRLLDWEGALK